MINSPKIKTRKAFQQNNQRPFPGFFLFIFSQKPVRACLFLHISLPANLVANGAGCFASGLA